MVAWLVLFAGVMHTLAHLVNYGLSPDYTWQFYGIWPWTTGVGIFICMMFMYGAAPANVKNHHFEVSLGDSHWALPDSNAVCRSSGTVTTSSSGSLSC